MSEETETITIEFDKVGREEWSDRVTFKLPKDYKPTADDIAALAYREARNHLSSMSVLCVYHMDKNEGNIYAGFHHVGSFKVVS